MTTCGWCGTSYAQWQSKCSSCGGPLPPQPGMGIGPEPPPAPRKLPKGFAFRVKWSRNIAVLGGLFCMAISSLMLFAMIKAKTWFAVVPGLFDFAGVCLFIAGRKRAVGILRAFRRGATSEGKISEVSLDTTQSVNGRHPWKLVYQFPVGEELHEGSFVSFDSVVGSRSSGQPVWVLYVPSDPTQSTLYPPVRLAL